ncbi:MAG: transketolase [Blautia sp.]|jgi:transketolase
MEKQELMELRRLSADIRLHVLKMLKWRTYGHLGGSMSIVEVLSVLYGKHMRHDPQNPDWEDRDFLVLSKGHSGPALYSVLAVQGYFDESLLYTLNEGGTLLPSHPDRTKTPGVDATTGSLGQGTSVAAGLGYGLKKRGSDQYVYLIVGDGELNEGQCWEAFQFLANYRLDHVIVLIDENKRQLDGYTEQVMNPFDIQEKMRAFGFHTQRVKGNDEEAISDAIETAKRVKGQAVCIVLDTIKGQGVKYFEEMEDNHSVKFQAADNLAAEEAIKTLEAFVAEGRDA